VARYAELEEALALAEQSMDTLVDADAVGGWVGAKGEVAAWL